TGLSAVSADGVVTRAEYIQAVMETVACLEGRGMSAGAAPDDFGSYSISVTPPPGYGEAEANAAYDACYAAELAAIEAPYLDSIRPSEVEYQSSVTSCLADLGLVEAGAPWDEVRQVVTENFSTAGVEECWIDPYRFEE
ncbi:MAG TPA: hypothetical protein VJR05_12200, partial [Acidimicrobiia bacterium]|nr:hypothetical protein [Acidimicrobiia bacterium]